MLRMLRKRIHSEKGFTLIELLVVILIIGILAAIALPAFLNQREKGQDAEAKSATRTAATAMETCSTDNNGSYATCDGPALVTIEPSLSNAEALVGSGTADGYTVTTGSAAGARTFSITRAGTGRITRTCTVAGGGCGTADGQGNQW